MASDRERPLQPASPSFYPQPECRSSPCPQKPQGEVGIESPDLKTHTTRAPSRHETTKASSPDSIKKLEDRTISYHARSHYHARLPEGTREEIAGQELRAWDMLNLGQLDMIDGEHTSPRAAVRREKTNRRMGATNHP